VRRHLEDKGYDRETVNRVVELSHEDVHHPEQWADTTVRKVAVEVEAAHRRRDAMTVWGGRKQSGPGRRGPTNHRSSYPTGGPYSTQPKGLCPRPSARTSRNEISKGERMKITTEQLLDEALAVRAEATLVGRCPRCGSNNTAIPAPATGYHEGTFHHEHWCPAVDDNIAKLFRRTGAALRHYPLEAGERDGRPVLMVLLGREGRAPLDHDQLDRLLVSSVPCEARN
jgi:hypothetical protein